MNFFLFPPSTSLRLCVQFGYFVVDDIFRNLPSFFSVSIFTYNPIFINNQVSSEYPWKGHMLQLLPVTSFCCRWWLQSLFRPAPLQREVLWHYIAAFVDVAGWICWCSSLWTLFEGLWGWSFLSHDVLSLLCQLCSIAIKVSPTVISMAGVISFDVLVLQRERER